MKKILLIHNILWSHYKAKVFTDLSLLCAEQQYDFKVIQIALGEKRREKMGSIDTSIHDYPFEILEHKNFDDINQISMAYKLIKKIRSETPDLVVLPGYDKISYLILSLYLKVKHIPSINICDSTFKDKSRKSAFKNFFKKIILNSSDSIFCYGDAAKKYLLFLGVSPDKIHIRVQATDNEYIKEQVKIIQHDKQITGLLNLPHNYFLYVGRISEEKNLFFLLKAFLLIQNKYPKWELIIIGNGVLKTQLSQFIKLNCISNITLLEGKTMHDLVPYYYYSKSLVLPSISEPWGVVVNEAMLCGCPILVSNHCGCSEELVFENINGYSFNPFSIDDIYRSMENIVLKTDDELNIFRQNSLEIIKPFNSFNSAMQMLDGIKKIFNHE